MYYSWSMDGCASDQHFKKNKISEIEAWDSFFVEPKESPPTIAINEQLNDCLRRKTGQCSNSLNLDRIFLRMRF